jgi:hypothetical protein
MRLRFVSCALPDRAFISFPPAQYSNQLEALNAGEDCKVIMFHVLPGNSLHIKKQTSGLKPTEGYDSHSSSNHQEWCVFARMLCSALMAADLFPGTCSQVPV